MAVACVSGNDMEMTCKWQLLYKEDCCIINTNVNMSGVRGIMIYTSTQLSKLIGKNSKKKWHNQVRISIKSNKEGEDKGGTLQRRIPRQPKRRKWTREIIVYRFYQRGWNKLVVSRCYSAAMCVCVGVSVCRCVRERDEESEIKTNEKWSRREEENQHGRNSQIDILKRGKEAIRGPHAGHTRATSEKVAK